MPTKIEWCDETWNPITGCSPVSGGCQYCYARRINDRFNDRPFSEITLHLDRLSIPQRWRKPRKVFVCSMGDLFHKDVPENHIASVWGAMALAPQHTFMILTKRVERMAQLVTQARKNVWLGATVENQQEADKRTWHLLSTPAYIRFISVEPMLGPVVFPAAVLPRLDWVICGGETGSGARFMHPHWVENLRDQCTEAGVPFFFKGWGTKMMKKSAPGYMMIDGKEWKEFPMTQTMHMPL